MNELPLISVVIPAYNAQGTLKETLESVCRQSHGNLEIIVVDDGSQDQTGNVARDCAAQDARIQVLRTPNRGVAAARNAGIAASTGVFVALVDADDLWNEKKLEMQLAALLAGGPETGFAYTLYHIIDATGQVIGHGGDVVQGPAFLRALLLNFVGNGSAMLIRRSALEAVGGFDTSLHAASVQGCDDYLAQILIARHWKVACVPQYLTYYRKTDGGISSNKVRMRRSRLKALDIVLRQFPETPRQFVEAASIVEQTKLAFAFLRDLRFRDAARAMTHALRQDPILVLRTVWFKIASKMRHLASRALAQRNRTTRSTLPHQTERSARLPALKAWPLFGLYAVAEEKEAEFFKFGVIT